MPIRNLLEAGILVAGSSDWPVVSCNPMLGIQRAVTRITETGEPVHPRQAVSVQEAVTMYTRDAAKILGKYDRIGSLEPGKQANFILLSEDPFKTPASKLSKLKVAHTYLGGKSVFKR